MTGQNVCMCVALLYKSIEYQTKSICWYLLCAKKTTQAIEKLDDERDRERD